MKSISTEGSICKLINGGVLPDAAIEGWRPSVGESYLEPHPGELIIFEDFYWHRFRNPCHPFLCKLLDYYKVSLCNLHPNSILSISIFINFCEAYLGIYPHFNLWCHLFCLKKKGDLRVQNSRRSVSAASGSHGSTVSECPSKHLNEGLVPQMVLHAARAGTICDM
jgi:hypothetical protein